MTLKVKHLEENIIGRDFIVGDLHGEIDMLYSMMKHVNFDEKVDRMFSVGDLVDRGKKSYETAMLIYMDWFYSVIGNHEEMMIDSMFPTPSMYGGTDSLGMWLDNGGQWMHQSSPDDLVKLAEDVSKLPYCYIVGTGEKRFNIVHAELVSNQYLEPVTDADLDIWNFNSHNMNSITWGRKIITHPSVSIHSRNLSRTFVGHTPMAEPTRVGNHYFIDTGACFFGYKNYQQSSLTMVDIANDIIYNMSSIDGYIKSSKLAEIKIFPCKFID